MCDNSIGVKKVFNKEVRGMPRMLVATAPRKAAIVEYQDRKVAANLR